MKNQYLILRLSAADLYDNQFLMRGFNRKRIENVIGVIVAVDNSDNLYHLTRIRVDLLQSDTQQNWARLSWSSIDRESIDLGMERLPPELSTAVRAMRNNRMYHTIDTTIPVVFRDRHTEFAYTPSAVRKIANREKTGTLDTFTVEEIVAHLKTRISGVTITF